MKIFRDILLSILILATSTLIGFLFREYKFHETNIVVIYIFSVLLISRFTRGYICGIAASVISILLFNWFFAEPYFTLKVHDMTYLITFAIMMFTSIVTSTLTTKVKQAAENAKEREKISNALYQMTNHLSDAEDAEAIAQITVSTTSEVLSCNTSCICFDEKGIPEKTFIQRKEDGNLIRRELKNPEELSKRIKQVHNKTDIMEENYLYPIYGKDFILAVLRVPQEIAKSMTGTQTKMLHSIIESSALALERLRSLQEQVRSREETTQERYRSNLLRAISHDIRTPLSGIMGTSEMLMSITDKNQMPYNLAKDIYEDAQWLHGMVENILNLTRLQDGKLSLNKELEAIEEVIGVVLLTMEKQLPGRVIDVEMPENLVMVPMDVRLISQVFINLLDNANKHTEKDKEILISVSTNEENVCITVSDKGSGISEKDLPNIFQMFYTSYKGSPDAKRGVGLGLAICQSIVEAHGGKIWAENKKEGGAAFTFTLPMGEKL